MIGERYFEKPAAAAAYIRGNVQDGEECRAVKNL